MASGRCTVYLVHRWYRRFQENVLIVVCFLGEALGFLWVYDLSPSAFSVYKALVFPL